MKVFIVLLFMIFGLSQTTEFSKDEFTDTFQNPDGLIGTKNNFSFVFKSSHGMYFTLQKYNDFNATVYDCNTTNINQGEIEVSDVNHPKNYENLVIKNCQNITLHMTEKKFNFKSIIIQNITFLTVKENYNCSSSLLKFHVEDIDELTLLNSGSNCENFNVKFLKLKNVGIKELSKSIIVSNILLDGVKFCNNSKLTVIIEGNSSSVLSVKNSYFIQTAELFTGQTGDVNIFNNSFFYLNDSAFDLVANSFVFSNNYVENIRNAFKIKSSEIEITWNTFENTENFQELGFNFANNFNTPSLCNISENTFKSVPSFLSTFEITYYPDILVIKNNKLYCSCKTAKFLATIPEKRSILQEIFLNELNNNLCFNISNCSLNKIIRKPVELCSDTFVCPDDEKFISLEDQINLIYSTLQDILQNTNIIAHNYQKIHNSITDNSTDV